MPVCERHGMRQNAAALPANARALERIACDVFMVYAVSGRRSIREDDRGGPAQQPVPRLKRERRLVADSEMQKLTCKG